MNAGKIYFFGVVSIVVLVLVYTFVFTGKKDSYKDELIKFRVEKDEFFSSDPESPVADKDNFKQLSYFSPDQSYRIMADIERIEDTTRLKVGRTDGTTEYMRRYAFATFQLRGRPHKLLLLKSEQELSESRLFLPFTDKTNGLETYGGGRYLDIEWKEGTKKIMLDFNFAYNPFCAYNPNYSCPIPPSQNHLEIPIRAGEKTFGK